jgi:hypothetical protein
MTDVLELTPQEATAQVKDISVTERGQFRSCRRRWKLQTLDNLEPREPTWAFAFGTGMHSVLEVLHAGAMTKARVGKAHDALDTWAAETELKLNEDGTDSNANLNDVFELRELGHTMIDNYVTFDKTAKIQLGDTLAIEGKFLKGAKKPKPKWDLTDGYPEDAMPMLHESGRILVPIVDPDTHECLPGRPMLSGKIDLLTMRKSPHAGLCVVDHKNYKQAPSDRGLDFDDQVTGYCYIVYRWLGLMPRSVIFNVLIKQAPKEPRLLANGDLSTAKDQLTTPDLYRAALKEAGLMKGGKVHSEKHAECMAGLLARGWDPFFRRYQPTRNEQELVSFERRLASEYADMAMVRDNPEMQYPNLSSYTCPGCSVKDICQAMEDGSDPEYIIETHYRVGEDRKAA